jgi:hypothetical protein
MTTGIQHTASVALYLRQLLVAELGGGVVPPMPDWSLDCLEELHFAVKVIKQAVQNKSTCKLIDNISNLMDKEVTRAIEVVCYRLCGSPVCNGHPMYRDTGTCGGPSP